MDVQENCHLFWEVFEPLGEMQGILSSHRVEKINTTVRYIPNGRPLRSVNEYPE
jgi:hypothetical protein